MDSGADWTAQLRRGVLELCVLGLIRQEPIYGYELLSRLSRWDTTAVSEGTLYPLLRRLDHEGLIAATWRESDAGPVRKYYNLLPAGLERLVQMETQWRHLSQSVGELLANGGTTIE